MFSTLPRREFCRSGTKKNGVGFADAGILSLWRSDDLHPAPRLEAPAERAVAPPVALGHGFVDHSDDAVFFVIRAVNYVGDKRNAHGDEIVVADFVVLDGGRFSGGGW